ncbi:DUF6685 family protein [Azohydromonas australica]|uniref:DUF6685 family protein n=1 Tax=Azohydromonas australica TaxID=364039 RepID=UPI0012EC26AD|nr:DUF6685 family protein [Azohydromonas australica]
MPIPRSSSSCFPAAGAPAAAPEWPDRECLSDVPRAVLGIESWPAWRRLLRLPDAHAFQRIDAWRGLVQALSLLDSEVDRVPFDQSRDGIFAESRPCWNQFTSAVWERSEFEGLAGGEGRIRKISVKNPFGPLTMAVKIDDFTCDICDVDGIMDSRSSDLYFESVAAFGQRYCMSMRTEINQRGLAEMLGHGDTRVIHLPGSKTLSIWFWDGRLFLCNSGGAQRFAGAAFIAEVIRQPVPLKASLLLRWLNTPAWNWLLSRYFMLYTSDQKHCVPRRCLAGLVEQVFFIELGLRCIRDDVLLLVPKNTLTTTSVIELLEGRGFEEVNRVILRLLRCQEENRRILSRRWPEICTPPWLASIALEK